MMMENKSVNITAPDATARAALITLPQEVLEMIVNHLHGTSAKNHLALCCKAALPILCMGRVGVHTDKQKRDRPLLQATRCLMKHPGGVSHLEVWSTSDEGYHLDCRHLIDLSLLSNLCKLTLHGVAVSMPALQPVATRLRELNLDFSRLQGSADGFLTRGWTALTTLSLAYTSVEAATMTAALELPALEEMDIVEFKHQGGLLQLDQLTGGCPKIRGLRLQLDINMARGIDSTGPCCSLLNLGQLADLYICMSEPPLHANLELALPASLTHFEVDECNTDSCVVDFFWALSVAAKCLCRGAQLRKVTCRGAVVYLQPAQWGASLDEQYRRLGGQLSGLKELAVCSSQESLLRALSAVVSSAPNLTCVTLTLLETLPHLELPAICSASLERFIVDGDIPISSLVLTFLPGCTRLQEVLVQIYDFCSEGNAVKIRCHSCSPTCIVPVGAHQCAGHTSEVGVQLLPGTPLMQGVQGYTSCTYATLPDPSSHLCGVMLSFPGSCNVHSAGIKLAFCETFELKN